MPSKIVISMVIRTAVHLKLSYGQISWTGLFIILAKLRHTPNVYLILWCQQLLNIGTVLICEGLNQEYQLYQQVNMMRTRSAAISGNDIPSNSVYIKLETVNKFVFFFLFWIFKEFIDSSTNVVTRTCNIIYYLQKVSYTLNGHRHDWWTLFTISFYPKFYTSA